MRSRRSDRTSSSMQIEKGSMCRDEVGLLRMIMKLTRNCLQHETPQKLIKAEMQKSSNEREREATAGSIANSLTLSRQGAVGFIALLAIQQLFMAERNGS